jgi:hypothetical protein
VFDDETVQWIEGAGLGEQRVGVGGVAEQTSLAGLLNEFSNTVFVGDGKGEGVVGVAGVQLDGFGELGFGGGEIFAVEQACPVKVRVFCSLKLALSD